MNSSSDLKLRLLRALIELARELPPGTLTALVTSLESNGSSGKLSHLAATPGIREKLRRLEELCAPELGIDSKSVGFALRTAAEAVSVFGRDHHTEIAWTGPATEAVPLRRVDQVIYDMVTGTHEEVLLVTYAAYKAERLLTALRGATDRGVRVRLVLELAHESGGKITFDGLTAFRKAVPSAAVYFWPLHRRKLTPSGAYGAMHAKCVVADRSRALVSSANLTDYALESNMELGLYVERSVAMRLAEHFDQLIVREELVLAS